MVVRHPQRRGEGISASDDITVTGDWSFTGSLTIPEASVTAHTAAIDHDALLNFEQDEHFTQADISITVNQISDFSSEGGLKNIVEDVTPELGGDLDALGNNIVNVNALQLNESPSAPYTSGDGKGLFWVKTDGDNAPMFMDGAGLDSRMTRNRVTETIYSDWTHEASLIMGDEEIVKWLDDSAVAQDMLRLATGVTAGAAVGHIIVTQDDFQTTTSATYVDISGAVVPYASMEANEDYVVFVRAYIGNTTSTTTNQNKCRLTKDGSLVGGSEHIYESPGTTAESVGMIYEWGGVVNSGASGDLQLQHLSGNGSDTMMADNINIMMIKVDDLTLNTNVFHDTDATTVELDDGNFPPLVWFDTGAGVTIGDGVSDYLVFGSVRITDFLTGGNTVSVRVNDGSTTLDASGVGRGDSSDQLSMGFAQFWTAPAASTTLTVEAQGTGFPVDKDFASIVAIRLNAFTEYQSVLVETSPDLGDGPTTISTIDLTVQAAGDFGFMSGATGPSVGLPGSADYVTVEVDGGGAAAVAGSNVIVGIHNVTAAAIEAHWSVSADQALNAGEVIEAKFLATDATTPQVYENCFFVAFQWTISDTSEKFDIGNPAFAARYLGDKHRFYGSDGADYVQFEHDDTDFNISGFQTADINITDITAINAGTVDADFDAITGTSFGGIVEANLLDKTATEDITGNWNFKAGSGGTDFLNTGGTVGLNVSHPGGNDVLIATVGTVQDVKFSGATVQYDFDNDVVITGPLTATSFGGILSANLLDKSATEIVSGAYRFSTDLYVGSASASDVTNVFISGASGLSIRSGTGSGGWARGFVPVKHSDSTRMGGAGWLGSNETLSSFNIGFSSDWWLGDDRVEFTATSATFGADITTLFKNSENIFEGTTGPGFYLRDTDAATDEKVWRMDLFGGNLRLSSRADDLSGGAEIFLATRGTGTAVASLGFTPPVTFADILQMAEDKDLEMGGSGVGLIRCKSQSLADDATGTWDIAGGANGYALHVLVSTYNAQVSGIFAYTTDATRTDVGLGALMEMGTSANPDVDAKCNVWKSAAAELSIKNRLGSTRTFTIWSFSPHT